MSCLFALGVIFVPQMKCDSELALPKWYLPPRTLKRFSIREPTDAGVACEDVAPSIGSRKSVSNVLLWADELSEELLEDDSEDTLSLSLSGTT